MTLEIGLVIWLICYAVFMLGVIAVLWHRALRETGSVTVGEVFPEGFFLLAVVAVGLWPFMALEMGREAAHTVVIWRKKK